VCVCGFCKLGPQATGLTSQLRYFSINCRKAGRSAQRSDQMMNRRDLLWEHRLVTTLSAEVVGAVPGEWKACLKNEGAGWRGMPCVSWRPNRRAWRCISDAKFRAAQTLQSRATFSADVSEISELTDKLRLLSSIGEQTGDLDGGAEEDSQVCAGKAHHRPKRCTPKEKPTQG
jgi:hypothetical protein